MFYLKGEIRINIEQLKYIVEVSRTQSMSVASRNLYVSRPAISQAITNLEEELQIDLFKRSRSGVIPTKEGKNIIEKAKDIVMKLQSLEEEARILASIKKTELRLVACPSLFSLTSQILLEYKGLFPDLNIEITEKASWDVINEVKQKNFDIGFTAIANETMKVNEGELTFDILQNGNMSVFVNKNSPLALRDSITPEYLVDQSIVLYQSDSLKSLLDDFKDKYGNMSILLVSNNMDLIKRTLVQGVAITILPNNSLKNDPLVRRGEIKVLPLVGHRLENIFYVSICSKMKKLSIEDKHFIRFFNMNLTRVN